PAPPSSGGAPAPAPSEATTETTREPAPPVQRPEATTPPTVVLAGPPPTSTAWFAAPKGAPSEILVIAKTGRVPYKVPQRIPIGAAIGLAGAYVTGDTTLLEYGMFKVVTYPELVKPRNLFADAEMRIDGKRIPMDEATNLGHEIA